MTHSHHLESFADEYARLLLDYMSGRMPKGRRTFGFEYEFMPDRVLDLKTMEALYDFLETIGFTTENGCFKKENGMEITFEPGGQIEYHSLPLLPEDSRLFRAILADIENTNHCIYRGTGIEYIPVGYIPGRGESPLCLDSERYIKLHRRLGHTGSRGKEMMKGTASIHLHTVIRHIDEMVPIFLKMRDELMFSDLLSMKSERRDIWKNTDPTRCGLPFENIHDCTTGAELLREFVTVSLRAEELGSGIPFYQLHEKSFQGFLAHHTTVFTDIRLNAKGPTMELRTPDSVPFETFEKMWHFFTQQLQEKSG